MYGRQPPQAYPRQYGNAYPPQQQQQQPPQQGYAPQYPPQAHQQYPPQGQYAPQSQYAPRQAYPGHHHQQQQPPPGYGGGAYGHPGPHAPPAMPAARGSLPYGRSPAPAAVSSYESQAQKWKKGFSVVPNGAGAGSSGSTRQADIEAPLIAELCSSAGSSYPPRDVLQKLLRHLPSLDHQYVCELLDDKLDDRVWQVQGKALSVLDALFKSQEAEFYKTHYYRRAHILEALCNSRKELLKARAEKVYNVIRSHVPPAPVEPANEYNEPPSSSSLLPHSPVITPSAPAPMREVNLLGSPMLMGQEEPAEAPPSSAFGFLNSSIGSAAAPPAETDRAEPSAASAFSFLQPTAQPEAPLTRVVAVTPVVAAAPAAVDIFSSLPPPTPVVGGMIAPDDEPAPAAPVEEEEPKVHDPIHDAFEGLNFDDDDETAGGENSENPLDGFTTATGGTMAVHAPVIKVDPSDPTREIILEVDVPAGPMGLMLDRSIPHMAVVQGFLRMPTGERGYLELHPVLCPGCALVSINGVNVEEKGLEEIGAVLGSLMHVSKVLRFKKLMRSGRTVSPADPDVVYVPPPPEKVEAPPAEKDDEEDEEESAQDGDGSGFIARLNGYSAQLDAVEQQIEELVQRDRSNLPVGDLKNQLAQLHGDVEKIQTQGIDAVILGANPPPNADEIRQLRSSLVRRSDELTKRIQKIAMNGTAPSPLVAPVAVGSPEVSAFSFVGGAGGMPPMPSLQLPEPTPAPPSAVSGFSFMQASDSPVSSPLGAGPLSSAFSFMAGGGPAPSAPTPAAPSNAVFAGLSLRGVRGSEPVEAPSAFGFLSGAASASAAPAVGVMEPPRVASPTAFSFLRGGAGPASPPTSPPASGPPGSAFSFIS